MRKKVVFLPYDFDTAIGINNEGELGLGYELEDTDHLESGADVYNGQDSVLWNNLRDAFPAEVASMYASLVQKINYDVVEQMFEEHQAKWPEALFNEDAWFKYIEPLINDGDDSYLEMLQGSKEMQRKWWLNNRFRYLDSKYNAGSALTDYIQLRAYAKSDVTVVPYASIYATVKYGSYLVQKRALNRGAQYTLECPVDRLNDTEVYIYSASQLSSVGDLSGLMVGFADFSRATRLQSIKLGDGTVGYSNGNLKTLGIGNLGLLRDIDVQNCPNLKQFVDLSGCPNLVNARFDGTNITGIRLPNGGLVETVHVPNSIANLTIRNQAKIKDLAVDEGVTWPIWICSTDSGYTLDHTKANTRSGWVRSSFIHVPENQRLRLTVSGMSKLYVYAREIDDTLRAFEGFLALDPNQKSVIYPDEYLNSWTGIVTFEAKAEVSMSEASSHIQVELVSAPYANITTLWLENTPTLDTKGIIKKVPASARVRLLGFNWECENAAEIEALLGVLDSMRGLDESGNNLDQAQISGTIHTNFLTGSQIADYNSRYPYLKVEADHTESTLTYWNYEGTEVLHTETVYDGGDGSWTGSPSHASTAQYNFAFVGWNKRANSTTADATALQGIVADRNVYAAYTLTTRTYTVHFVNQHNSSDNADVQNVPYGGSASYPKGTTPTYSGNNEMAFSGWSPTGQGITGETYCYAQFTDLSSPVVKYLKGTLDVYESNSNTTIGGCGLGYQNSLKTIKAPITTIGSNGLANTNAVELVDLVGDDKKTIAASNYASKTKLKDFIIRSTEMSTLANVNAFSGTPIAAKQGTIYVPDALVDTYKADSVWKNFFITGISKYPNNDFTTIEDGWATICANAAKGDVDKYPVGGITKIVYNGNPVYMQIVGKFVDPLADDSGKYAALSLLSLRAITTHAMNTTNTNAGGWAESNMLTWLNGEESKLDETTQKAIVAVTKTYYDHQDGAQTKKMSNRLWIPSMRELGFTSTPYESEGPVYSDVFTNDASRIKYNANFAADWYWSRTCSAYTTNFRSVNSYGSAYGNGASYSGGVLLGFSVGSN